MNEDIRTWNRRIQGKCQFSGKVYEISWIGILRIFTDFYSKQKDYCQRLRPSDEMAIR